jgi:truncated hemoglobin YjbI
LFEKKSAGDELGVILLNMEVYRHDFTNTFPKYGGFSKISSIVMSFCDTLLDSDEIGPFVDGIDISKMVGHQTKFIASLFGGPASYTNRRLCQSDLPLKFTLTRLYFELSNISELT